MVWECLKALRLKKNMTQKDLANALGLSPQRYNYYERGLREPDNKMLVAIADYFDVSVDYLLGRNQVWAVKAKVPVHAVNEEKALLTETDEQVDKLSQQLTPLIAELIKKTLDAERSENSGTLDI